MTAKSHGASSAPLLARGVRRALDAMRANVGRDWSLTDLAGVSGMSGRTLQRQFRSFLGKTPRAVLRDIRFELARRELLHGSPGSKVMDVAEDCGLTHFGRFSVLPATLWRDAIADPEDASRVRRCSCIDA